MEPMAAEAAAASVSYEDLAAIEDEFEEIDLEISA
jgi:DNA-binding GntR family transcriptional regulator